MGALRLIWRRPRGRRVAGAAVLAAVAVGGAVACDPNGLSSASVAFTTDLTATRKLERENVSVRWLTCTASYDNGSSPSAASATENTVAKVDCQGKTDDGQDITVTGKVTRAVNGACVRGDLTAKVDGKVVFHVEGLGNCNARSTPPVNNPGQPGPTVTVTVTRTIWCQGDPQCWPVEGK